MEMEGKNPGSVSIDREGENKRSFFALMAGVAAANAEQGLALITG
jgi:hypothetical protein